MIGLHKERINKNEKIIKTKEGTCECYGDLIEGFNYHIVWEDNSEDHWLEYETSIGKTWSKVVKYLTKLKGMSPEQIQIL